MSKIYVATTSPRRIKLLRDFGFAASTLKPCMEHARTKDIKTFSIEKAKSKIECIEKDGIIVGFDTIVAHGNEILEKPKNIDEARNTLMKLSDRWHEVITGMVFKENGRIRSYNVITRVKFIKITEKLLDIAFLRYNPLDKAGAYAIQEFSGIFVERIEGDYYNVVGLPLVRFYEVLRYDIGLDIDAIFQRGI